MGNKTLRPQNLKLVLRAQSGLAVGTIYPLPLERNVIGRSVEATVPLDDTKVSRNHASIDIQNGFHYVVDLSSINGTYLNGRRLGHAELISVGDELRVGSVSLRVELLDQAKEHLGRTWRETTRAVAIADLQAAAPHIRQPIEKTGSRWQNLLPGQRFQGDTQASGRSRWLMLGLCFLLVAAALATTLGRAHPPS